MIANVIENCVVSVPGTFSTEVLSVLIETGGQGTVKDDFGNTTFDYAKDNPSI